MRASSDKRKHLDVENVGQGRLSSVQMFPGQKHWLTMLSFFAKTKLQKVSQTDGTLFPKLMGHLMGRCWDRIHISGAEMQLHPKCHPAGDQLDGPLNTQ